MKKSEKTSDFLGVFLIIIGAIILSTTIFLTLNNNSFLYEIDFLKYSALFILITAIIGVLVIFSGVLMLPPKNN